MNYDKMILVPYGEDHVKDNILLIILKLAKINAYDQNLYMKINNKFNKKVNIIDYLNLLNNNNNSKQQEHEKEFIDLLIRANIEPEFIKNQNIREKITNNSKLLTNVSPIKQKLNWIKVD